MAEQEHDKTTLLGLQKALAQREQEVSRASQGKQAAIDDLSRVQEQIKAYEAHALAEHAARVAQAEQHEQQALAEREVVSAQIAEVAQRIGT